MVRELGDAIPERVGTLRACEQDFVDGGGVALEEFEGDIDTERPGHWASRTAATSRRMSSKACSGEGAAMMGRPMTRREAPSWMAEAGVPMRRWSPGSEPAGRMPGTMSR